MSSESPRPPFIARTIRRFSLLIILAWLVLILILDSGIRWREMVVGNPIAGAGRRDAFRSTDA